MAPPIRHNTPRRSRAPRRESRPAQPAISEPATNLTLIGNRVWHSQSHDGWDRLGYGGAFGGYSPPGVRPPTLPDPVFLSFGGGPRPVRCHHPTVAEGGGSGCDDFGPRLFLVECRCRRPVFLYGSVQRQNKIGLRSLRRLFPSSSHGSTTPSPQPLGPGRAPPEPITCRQCPTI